MKKGALLAFSAAIFALAAPLAGLARAQSRSQGALPLDRLLPEIRRSHPGQVYDAEGPERGADGALQYRLKWMTPDGRIVWLNADARTGRVLGSAAPPSGYAPPAAPSGGTDRFGAAPSFGHDDEERYQAPSRAPSSGRDGGGYGGGGFGGGRERSRGGHWR